MRAERKTGGLCLFLHCKKLESALRRWLDAYYGPAIAYPQKLNCHIVIGRWVHCLDSDVVPKGSNCRMLIGWHFSTVRSKGFGLRCSCLHVIM